MYSKSVIDLIDQAADPRHSKSVFASIKHREYTYGEFSMDIHKTMEHFKECNLVKGQVIVISTTYPYHMAVLYFSMLRYGLVTVFVDPEVPTSRFHALCKKASVDGYIMDADLFRKRELSKSDKGYQLTIQEKSDKHSGLLKKLLKKKVASPSNAQGAHYPEVIASYDQFSHIDPPIAEDLAYIIFTSGTTSAPKGVMITHGNLFSHMTTLSNAYGLTQNSKVLNILNLYHADGINQGPLLAAYNLACWNAPFGFDIAKLADLFLSIYKYRISHLIAVPAMLSIMKKYSEGYEDSFESDDFQFVISVAAKLESDLWYSFEEKFKTKVANVYGLTETVNGAVFNMPNNSKRKIGSIGVPIDCEVKLIPIKEEGNPNAQGELWIKGAHIFAGYIGDDQATKAVKSGEWFNSGDIASVDEDGNYYILGRIKNTISTGGFNIYPEQISEVVNSHPEVAESICFGVSDDHFEERIAIAIVLNSASSINENDLLDYAKGRLERNQVPKLIYLLDELPKGISGKVQLDKVKALIQSIGLDDDASKTVNVADAILDIAVASFGQDKSKISLDDNSHSLDGWDSMAHLDFITKIEERFSIELNTAEMMIMNSLQSAARVVKSKLSQK
ncbi:MAG: AMP-binding protein [Cyclobacteriaceae bacterium]